MNRSKENESSDLPELPDDEPAAAPIDEPIVEPGQADSNRTNQITNEVDRDKIAQFVTTIRNAEEQVGQHIIAALQHDNTVAVITTVAVGPDGNQRVISAALNPDRLKQVQEILMQAEEEREDEEPCVGFHCLVKPKLS
ncbi:hypothetical protein [Rubripirellula reticaptiva]|uniref:Uncharacterized protein n=1 Tax=Rubripirellula reticaptiva TaxID=2528013 RepID=A0A5C6FDI9_9BACT|nr:hypothetical protein [Rubripirellula reticaptiva]TWU58314.1 hypothetical protein Poly59_12250 [Rubripirellula reticaptiva]